MNLLFIVLLFFKQTVVIVGVVETVYKPSVITCWKELNCLWICGSKAFDLAPDLPTRTKYVNRYCG